MKEKIIHFIKNARNNDESHEHFEELALELWKWQLQPRMWSFLAMSDRNLEGNPCRSRSSISRCLPHLFLRWLQQELNLRNKLRGKCISWMLGSMIMLIKGRELLIGSVPSSGGYLYVGFC